VAVGSNAIRGTGRATVGFLAGALAVMSVLGAGCTSPGDDPGIPVPVEPRLIYAQNCARCHGGDGRGDPEIKKTLPVRDFSDPVFQARASNDEVARVIMTGKGQMPSFGSALSAPKIQALSGYVRRLGKGTAVH
jgi:mono/diheme cytochrome c family protein